MPDSDERSKDDQPGGDGDHRVGDSGASYGGVQWREAADPYPGSRLLSGPSPSAVLKNIVDGDPLGIEARAVVHLRDRAILLPLDRLVLRTMARVSLFSMSYRGEPPLAQWIRGRIDDAIDDLINEDREAEREGKPLDRPLEHHFALIADLFGIDPALTRRASLIVNDLPDNQRKALWALVIEGLSVERYVALGHEKNATLAALRSALQAVSRANEKES